MLMQIIAIIFLVLTSTRLLSLFRARREIWWLLVALASWFLSIGVALSVFVGIPFTLEMGFSLLFIGLLMVAIFLQNKATRLN